MQWFKWMGIFLVISGLITVGINDVISQVSSMKPVLNLTYLVISGFIIVGINDVIIQVSWYK